tara:strand:+ start:1029 stop:1421 length:393 start_codon:yes stop_codon:yes gene_type:complete
MIIDKQRRNTIQREKIKQTLCSVKTHPTAESVYNQVKKEIPQITLATVYRNLNLLADQGEILKLEINKEFHYDGDISSHQHCVCRNCGQISDVFHKEISEYALKKVENNNFALDNVTVIFHGICIDCLND